MADDNRIIIEASLDTSLSAIDKIQKQLDGISKNVELKIINVAIDDKQLEKLKAQFGEVTKSLPTVSPKIELNNQKVEQAKAKITSVYVEGAKAAENLHNKQERLKQDYDILRAKAEKAGLSMKAIGDGGLTRENVNYNDLFNRLTNQPIGDIETYNRAKDALSALRKEFQLLNAGMQSELPSNAIENYNLKVDKLKRSIADITAEYDKLKNQNLGDKFSQLQALQSGANLSPLKVEDNVSIEQLNERVKIYTQIRRLSEEIKNDIQTQAAVEKEQANANFTKQKSELSQIAQYYRKINEYTKQSLSPSVTSQEKDNAEKYILQYRKLIDESVQRLQNEGLITTEISKQIQSYIDLSVEARDLANAKLEGKNAIANEKEYQNTLKETQKQIDKTIASLNKLNSNNVLKNNSSDVRVQNQFSNNNSIISQLQLLGNELKADSSANNLGMIKTLFETLSKSVRDATTDTTKLIDTFKNNEAVYKMSVTIENYNSKLGKLRQSIAEIKTEYESLGSKNLDSKFEQLQKLTRWNNLANLTTEDNISKEELNNRLGVYTQIKKLTEEIKADIQAQSEIEKEQAKSDSQARLSSLRQIESAYKKIGEYSKTALSSTATQAEKQNAQQYIDIYQNIVSKVYERMQAEGLLNDEAKQQIQLYDNILQETLAVAKARNTGIEAVNKEREYNKSLKETDAQLVKLIADLQRYNNSKSFKDNSGNASVQAQTAANNVLIQQLQALQSSLSTGISPEGLANVKAQLDGISGSLSTAVTNSKNLEQSLKDEKAMQQATAKLRQIQSAVEAFAKSQERAANSTKLMRSGVSFADEFARISHLASSGSLDKGAIDKLANDMRNFEREARAAGITSSKFFTDMGTQLKNLAMRYVSFYAMIGYIKSMVNSVKELDTAMVNLKRVTDATDIGYSKFKETAKEVAKEMRVTTGELVEQTYQWAKLGYGMEDALKMAKNTMLLSSVADMGQDDATKTLVTTLKSFRMEADQALTVVDKLDALNNKYATSAQGLSDALVRSASAMSSAGNSLDETLALLTGGGEITQNMEQTGNALRTISLRLRGMKGEIGEVEADVEDVLPVSKVQTQILNLTGSVDIFNKATGEFRSTYEILRDISEVWDDLSGTNRASLTEILFGKNRANVGLALIEAFQSGQIQKAFEDANIKNSAGTATAEFERMGDSIQARMDKLRASFATLSDDIIGSDLVKNSVDFLNLVVTGVDKVGKSLGGLSTIIGTVYAVAASKGSSTALLSGIMNAVSWLPHVSYEASNSIHALSGRMEEAVKGSKALSIGFGALQGVLIALAVKGVTVLIDKLIVTKAEMQEMTKQLVNDMTELKNATKETTDEISSITDLANEYSKIATTIDDTAQRKAELTQIQNDLNDRYTDESEKIDLINGKYSEQIGLMKEIADKKKEEFAYENADKINTARQLAQTNFGESNFILNDTGRYSMKSLDLGKDKEDKELADKIENLYTIRDLNREIVEIAKQTDGVRESTRGFFDDKGIYLSGNLENAKKQLEEIINNYKAMAGDDVDQTALKNMSDHYTLLTEALNDIKSVQPFLNDLTENSGLSEKQIQQYNSALDSVQDKLTQLANPKNMPIDQYGKLTTEVSDLKDSLYELAKGNKVLTEQVDGLFAAYNKGIAEGLTGFEQYVEEAQSILETSYTDTQTIVANVQGAIKNMSEGKGIAGTTALKMLKSDAEGLLKTVKIVNGEYFFGEQELIKYKDENIRKTQEELKVNIESSQASLTNLQNKAASHRREIQDIEKEISLIKSLNSISPNDAKALSEKQKRIQTINFQLAETEKDINAINGSIRLNNYVIQELGQNLGNANIQSKAVIDNYETLIKNLETEISTVDKSVDGLNARKDALNEEKDILNDQLDILKEQQKVLEDEQKTFKEIVDGELKRVEDSLKEQLDDIEEQTDAIKEQYDERIGKIKDENEQRDLAYNKEKALLELRNASEQMVKTYSSAQGWTYGADKSKVEEAQQKVDKLNVDEQIAQLERERDALLKPLQTNKKDLEKRISDFEKYAKQYTDTVEEIQNADSAMLAEQLLGADWREKISEQDSGILKRYQNEYQSYTDRIDSIKDNEIKSIEDSIKAKENDIKAIENQIKSYNNYKNELQNNLSGAKTALSDYKDSIANATANITDMFDTMARSAWESAYSQADAVRAMGETLNEQQRRLLDYYTSVAEASRDMQDALSESSTGYGIVNSAWDAYLAKHRYATGGVNDYTGMAWLDGTKSAPEVVLNNSDASKLWNLIHNLPTTLPNSFDSNIAEDRIASMNQNSISVNIEKIVADNPTQFVNGLDEALNKYFTTKLTQSYVY